MNPKIEREEDRWTNNSQSINFMFVDSVMDKASTRVVDKVMLHATRGIS